MSSHEYIWPYRPEALEALELESERVVNCLTWMTKTKLMSSDRASTALNC